MLQEKQLLYDPKLDTEFQKPYVDIDEWREGAVRYHYIHGGFEGTEVRFSFYFPEKEKYKGRFFQFMAPFQGHEDASQIRKGEEDKIGFAITNGAYFVESNMGGPAAVDTTIYRSSAAVAEYSRVVAANLYGPHRPFGYIYGGSGGGFKTISCFENTNTWDGAVPYIIGSPMAIPNVFTVRAHALRILRSKLPVIADALEPGGSGDIYAGLNEEERAALEEVTKMGFPTRVWFSHEYVGLGALPLFVPVIEQVDPEYLKDFWTVPGYLGAEPNSSAARDRLQYKTVINETHLISEDLLAKDETKTGADDAWHRHKSIDISLFKPWLKLESVPTGDVYLTGTDIVFLSGEAAGSKIPLDRLEGDKAYIAEGFGIEGMLEILEKVKPGDEIMLDNSNFIAIQTYHRHQVPSSDFHVWDQFRYEDGTPIYPQRPVIIGANITRGGAGSIQSGRFNGKMIVVAALLDESAYPWQPDWYRTKVRGELGDKESQSFRLWYMDNAMHDDQAKTADDLHLISYLGALHQALLDVSEWVEHGITPHESTQYSVIDGQVSVPSKANERKGIQPVVALKANGSECTIVNAGEQVDFKAEVEMPVHSGQLTFAEWSFEGETDFPVKGEFTNVSGDGTIATVEAKYIFSKPGTYFPVLRVKSNRHGDVSDIYTQVQNLCRVRVIVK
ncbi:hypothetical protein L1999_17320 [Neobacillus drentensis]|uniref:hypothetical protein n=1 Tax=Neobacillus drentensis TaxID=220684 RepID=UPI001F3FAE9E|nr:hypothetical protein [Neobacillus drentensis]ULT54899.1 hypothetical protein L1999_17320 [Neobacillus drentensis]